MLKPDERPIQQPIDPPIKYILNSVKHLNRRYICESTKLGQGAFSRVYKGWICECKTLDTQEVFAYSMEDLNDVDLNESVEDKPPLFEKDSVNDDDSLNKNECNCDKSNVEWVAVKKMHLTKAKSRKVLENEIEIMQNLNNPYIVNFIDVIYKEDEDQTIFIIIEYCGGGNLKEYVKNRRLKEKYARLFFQQIALGLEYLHSKSIIHRDIKPHNILLTTNRKTIKIADFGFAKIIGSDALTETMCGSPMYMAPEIIRGKSYTSKADLWSVGVMMYEALTGFHPFQGANSLYDLIDKIERYSKRNQLKFPNGINLTYFARDLLKRLLRSEPDERMEWKEFFIHKFFTDDGSLNSNSTVFNTDNPVYIPNALSPPSFSSPTIPAAKGGIGIRIIQDYESLTTKAISVPNNSTTPTLPQTPPAHVKPTKSISYISDYIGTSWSLLKDSIHSSPMGH